MKTLIAKEQIDALVADPSYKTPADRKRAIADHILGSEPSVQEELRKLWGDESFDPEERRFVLALFGASPAEQTAAETAAIAQPAAGKGRPRASVAAVEV